MNRTELMAKRDQILKIAAKRGVKRIRLFGSAARGDSGSSSDVDFLVEFSLSPDSPSLKAFFGLQNDLSQILGRAVDLAEATAIRTPYLQASVNRSLEVVYAA